MIKSIFTTLIALCIVSNATYAFASEPLTDKSIFDDGYPETAQVDSLTLSFDSLGIKKYKLDGINNNTRVDFTNRLDKLGKKLTLNFSFNHSPSLLTQVSHLKVYFNENLVTVLPIDSPDVINSKSHHITLNPKLIKDFNQVRYELVGYYDLVCQNYSNKSIWAELSKTSSITLDQQSLALESLLEYFPAPFFDVRDYTKLNLPFIFANSPDKATLEAAAALSSWFGAEADWRKANFPVSFNKTPTEHSVVFATNDNKPDFLVDYPDVTKPTVEIISSPTHRYAKVLLVLGKDSQQLKEAVTGLLFGHKVMTGRTASIEGINNLPLRKAYDAPRWVRSDRAVTFDEYTQYPNQLQSKGYSGQPINLDLRFAPDLFTWREKGIPIDLRYRNAAIDESLISRLNMLVNDKFVDGFTLKNNQEKSTTTQALLPILSDASAGGSEHDLELAGIELSKKNTLTYDFNFSLSQGQCSIPAIGEYGVIDGSSSIDVSHLNHYIALPDLNVFANSGFPFTKYADLHQTTILMEDNRSASAVNLLLNFTGHLGQITGYPAHQLAIKQPSDELDLDDKDIIIIAKPDSFSEALNNDSSLSVLLKSNQRIIEQAIYNGAYDTSEPERIKVSVKSQGELAIVSGFQSPYNSDRSVVSLIATNDNAYSMLSNTLIDEAKTSLFKGSSVIINSQSIKTIATDDQYFIGYVPIHTLIWYHFSGHPFLLAVVSILILLLLSFMLWRLLGVLTRRRLAEGDNA